MCIRKSIVLVLAISLLMTVPVIYARAASFGEIQTEISSIARQIAALANQSGQASLNPSGPICSGSLINGDCTKAGGKFVCTCSWSGDAANCPCSCVCSPCANEGELSYMATSAYEKQPHSCCAGLTAVMNAEYTGSTCAAPGNGTQRCVKYGDGKCEKEKGENECNSLKDCPYLSPVCGNSQCETGETATICPQDCGKSCEESCKAQGYTYSYCNSYAVTAGTSQCKEGYTSIGQAKDCYVTPGKTGAGKACCCTKPNPTCGNGKCETNETVADCPKDCGNKCEMASTEANPITCRTTCNVDEAAVDTSCNGNGVCCKKTRICGNSKCETNETAVDCPQDCGKSCEESCKAQGYTYSYCNSYAITANASLCKQGYASIGPTKDCFVPTGLVGAGKACCCTTPTPVCAAEGERIFTKDLANGKPTACCLNLTAISSCADNGACLDNGSSVCANCGDGTCGKEENKVNCPKDCGTNKCEMASTATNPLTCRAACNTNEALVDISCNGSLTCCKQAPVCANAGETIVSGGTKCCAGLVAQTPDGCLESEGCKPDSWICKNKHTDILAEINKIKEEIKQMMQRLQELMKELR